MHRSIRKLRINNNNSFIDGSDLLSHRRYFLDIEEFIDRKPCHETEYPVIGYIGIDHLLNFPRIFKSLSAVEKMMMN